MIGWIIFMVEMKWKNDLKWRNSLLNIKPGPETQSLLRSNNILSRIQTKSSSEWRRKFVMDPIALAYNLSSACYSEAAAVA